jgi:EAL domain-containing protein (putative c-di-GMP-specific phosphodiesterase class I)
MLSSTKSICVEVTENTDGLNASLLAEILPRLKQTGVYIAQDDIGNDAKPFCFELTNHAHILKFDRTWLHKISACSDYTHILKGFIAFAKLQRKKTVLEGIETPKNLALAKELGVDFVQGVFV